MPKANDYGPSIKDPDRYEALREKGYSKEKSARISNSPRHKAAVKGGQSPPYEEWHKDELYEKAKEVGIERSSTMRKGELIDALRNH
jgi:hypothetical protein